MVSQQDVFLLGIIHCLKSIIKSIKNTEGTANDIDFEHILEMERRNLSNPDLEAELIKDISDLEDLQ